MNKKWIIGIIIVLIVIGVVWKMNSHKAPVENQEKNTENTMTSEEAATQETNQLIDETVVDESDSGEVNLGNVI